MTQFVYAFNEGNIAMKDLLGGKGANLFRDEETRTTSTRWFYNYD